MLLHAYIITNTKTGRVYVGVTTQKPRCRWKFHLWGLRHGKHGTFELLADFAALGEERFTFQVVETFEADDHKSAKLFEAAWVNAFPDVYNLLLREGEEARDERCSRRRRTTFTQALLT